MSIPSAWDRIHRWTETHGSGSVPQLNPGASAEAIAELVAAIGLRLPGEFLESLRQHDGGDDFWLLPTHGELWGAEQILDEWTRNREGQESGGYADPDVWICNPKYVPAGIKPYFWSPKRIFVSDNSGDHITIDLDPAEGGQYGQVFYHSHETGPDKLLAPSWTAYLEFVANELESGRYRYDEEGCITDQEEDE